MVVATTGVYLHIVYAATAARTGLHLMPPTSAPTQAPQQSASRLPHPELPTDLPPDAGRAAAGIAIVLVAQLMLVLDASVVNVGLPRIDADLDFGPVHPKRVHALVEKT